MAHYAQIDSNNLVVNVFVGRDEEDLPDGIDDWEAYYATDGYLVKRTSYNTRGGIHYDPNTSKPSSDQSKAFRFNFASIGFRYDPEKDAFSPPQPFDSWVFNETKCLWEAPVPFPEDGQHYDWEEETKSWLLIS